MPGFTLPSLRWTVAGACLLAALSGGTALAQVFGPPSTIFGSVTDSAGEIPAGLTVQAYIGDTLCSSKGRTEFTGDGSGKVTVYFTDAVSREQITGCGFDGADVRVKIGDRFAPQTAKWRAGPVQLNVTFGSATPAPIPTFTPTPPRETPRPSGTVGTPTPGGGAGGAGTAAGGTAAGTTSTAEVGSPAATGSATLAGGVTRSNSQGPTAPDSGDGGFPLWAVAILALGGIVVIGGGAGYVLARSNRSEPEVEDGAPPSDGPHGE